MARPSTYTDAHKAIEVVNDDEEERLLSEWERVRRQRVALEKQKLGTDDKDRDDDDDGIDRRWLLAMNAQPNTDPFACFCRCNFKKLGQSYILHERRVVKNRRVHRELILVGPHWIGVMVTLSIIVGCTAMFLHQQCATLPWYYSALTLLFCFGTLYYLYGVACVDPGIVIPKHRRPRPTRTPKTTRTVLVDDDNQHDENDPHTSSDQDSDSEGGDSDLETGARTRARGSSSGTITTRATRSTVSPRSRICDVCEVAQDAFTEHCDDCGVCIEDYDHHCPWMGKCIGKNNMHAFKMFNLTWVVYVMFVLAVSIQNVDWGTVAVERLHRLSTGEWVPMGVTEAPTSIAPAPTNHL